MASCSLALADDNVATTNNGSTDENDDHHLKTEICPTKFIMPISMSPNTSAFLVLALAVLVAAAQQVSGADTTSDWN